MFTIIDPHIPTMCQKSGEHIICDDLPQQHTVDITSPDIDALLVDFLSEALYLSDVHNEAYFDADIHLFTDTHLSALIKGVTITGFEAVEIKAVTYHDLSITCIENIWQTNIVFDI